ncbi:hypothetical protein INT45_010423 [Circinella minor]|uniref:Tyr recombinase domain-containing protein n=1 Tax=Circinella minor TaxID=1195481 RepID=A0A8H7RRP0_9FUNG|nr:hypothetical protein INT45_010423 [Circinella minor]
MICVGGLSLDVNLFGSLGSGDDYNLCAQQQALPIRLHRSTINLQPTTNYLQSLDSHTITLATLQSKLAFLLGVTCFLRPSDLQRIRLASVSISDSSIFSFEVHSPKEKHKRRQIIKSFQLKSHTIPSLCPILTFNLFHARRPICQATSLFINSLQPDKVISTQTIHSWIKKLIKWSMDEKRVSLRSIASLLALELGIPKDNIVTMSNWSSSSTFGNHYRREHLYTFDFINTLITSGNLLDDDSNDDEVFYDATDHNMASA